MPPPVSERGWAYLVMIAENVDKHITLMLLYKIDCFKPLMEQKLDAIYHPLGGSPKTNHLVHCLWVIPLKNIPGIILGAGDRFTLIYDVRKPEFVTHPYPVDVESEEGKKSPSKLLYNAWTRSSQQKAYSSDKNIDLVYLAREDGQIVLLTIKSWSGPLEVTSLGCIGFDVDKAFAIIDLPDDEQPTFVIGGSHSNGGIASFRPKGFAKIQTIMANIDPVIDTALVPCWNNVLTGRKRIFVTSGRGLKHGAISEVRHGYANRVVESLITADGKADSVTVSKVWILPYDNEDYLITATPNGVSCQLYKFNKDMSGHRQGLRSTHVPSWSLVDRNSNHPWFSIFEDQDTITAALTRYGYYIRVTPLNIQRLSYDLTGIENMFDGDRIYGRRYKITSAVIDSYNARVLFAVDRGKSYSLECLNTWANGRHGLWSRKLTYDPSCMYIHNEDARPIAIVCTHFGSLQICDLEPGMAVLCRRMVKTNDDDVCESLMVLKKSDGKSLLMCGFRSGLLKHFDLTFIDRGKIELPWLDSISLGMTSVLIMPNYNHETYHTTARSALIFCEEASYVLGENDLQLRGSNLKQLWYADLKGNGLHQSAVLSLAVVPPWIPHAHLGTKDIFCVARNTIHQCRIELDNGPRNVPWQIHVGGSPHRVIWSDHHKRLVVGLTFELMNDVVPSSESKRSSPFLFSAIMTLDPNSNGENLEHEAPVTFVNNESRYTTVLDQSGDRISSLTEWSLDHNGNAFHMLLVTTHCGTLGKDKIQLFNFKSANGPLRTRITYRPRDRGSIQAVEVYDSTSIIALTEHYLIKLQLSSEPGLPYFREVITTKLSSPGTHLRLHQGQIIIGTKSRGLEIYTIHDQAFELVITDTSAYPSYHSTTVSTSSDPSTNLIFQLRSLPTMQGLHSHISAHHQGLKNLTPIFTVRLPSRITRLEQTSVPYRLQNNHHFPYPTVTAQSDKPFPYPTLSAFALDGAIYSLDVISLRVWRLLSIIQLAIEAKSAPPPPPPPPPSESPAKENEPIVLPGEETLERRYIDGDLLRRVVDLGDPAAKQFIRGLLMMDVTWRRLAPWLRDFFGDLPGRDEFAGVVLDLLIRTVDAA